MGIRNGEIERTVCKILDRWRPEIWFVEVCVWGNSASDRLKHSRCRKLEGTRDRRVVCVRVYRGQISVQISSWRIHSDASVRLEDRSATARWRCVLVCGPRDWGIESKKLRLSRSQCKQWTAIDGFKDSNFAICFTGSGNVRSVRFSVCSYLM